jgi:hypothetical protein
MSALLLLASLAQPAGATTGFDATTPAARFTGRETFTIDEEIQLWSSIERLEDSDRTLFTFEDFNGGLAWPDDAAYAPWIAECFGTSTPGSHSALLHFGPAFSFSSGTPILFVPGAGDNASRGFITMATRMNNATRPVFALTFAHPHGDVFQQAEMVANAIARIKHLTGAEQVDVVSHSKGGIASAIYMSNLPGTTWGRGDYDSVGTEYREDVRKAVFIAVPLGGVDTIYRWSSGNFASLDSDAAISPTSWETYYPSSSLYLGINTDLSAQDHFPEDGDLFPGQRQILRRWDATYSLPGESTWLGAYSLQQDWYTTYHGGLGYLSYSSGIDAAIEAGGDVIGSLESTGVHPDIELYLLAGTNTLMPNGTEDYLADMFSDAFVDLTTEGLDTWADFVTDLVGSSLVDHGIAEDEVRGLVQGNLVIGEITGPSDGLVFVDSALQETTLTARGAVVVDATTRNLSHLDLLYASPITGQLLIDAGEADPEADGWMRAVGERYTEADTLGWVEAALADPETGDDGGSDGGSDGGTGGDDGGDGSGDDGGGDGSGDEGGGEQGTTDDVDDTASAAEGNDGKWDGGRCSTVTATGGMVAWLAVLGVAARRRERSDLSE